MDVGEERADVYRLSKRTARKAHLCGACGEMVSPGERYSNTAVIYDGMVCMTKRCSRCEAIHKHLRESCEQGEWPSEGLDCGESYESVFGAAPSPEVQALAFALPGEVML